MLKGKLSWELLVILKSHGTDDETCTWGVQPVAHGPHAAQVGHECGPTQNCKCT